MNSRNNRLNSSDTSGVKTADKSVSADQDQSVIVSFEQLYERADLFASVALGAYAVFSFFLMFIYETWQISLAGNGIILLGYAFFRYGVLNKHHMRMGFAALLYCYPPLLIYQMEGFPLMHMFFVLSTILLFSYQNFRLIYIGFLPGILHYSIFFLLHLNGIDIRPYFLNVETIDTKILIFTGVTAPTLIFTASYFILQQIFESTKTNLKYISLINEQRQTTEKNVEFAGKIASEDFDTVYIPEENDRLGKALTNMREGLMAARRKENEERYTARSIADLNKLLRSFDTDTEEYYNQILKLLIKKVRGNQGAFFTVQEEETEENKNVSIRMIACYAYDVRKFFKKELLPGQGIIGQVYLEAEPLYINELPPEYSQVSSGLGQAPPKELLVFPVEYNGRIVGIIELASLKHIEKYRREFSKQAAGIIASSILDHQNRKRTKSLLKESEERAEMLEHQEVVMRKNLSELQAAQKEMKRRQIETENRIDAINKSNIGAAEFDLEGIILSVNQSFLRMLQHLSADSLVGKPHSALLNDTERENIQAQKELWEALRNGESRQGEFTVSDRKGENVYLFGAYSLIRDLKGNPMRVLMLVTDISETRELLIQSQEQTKALRSSQLEIEEKNKKMETNEGVLKKALTSSKEKEKQIQLRNKALEVQEEELRETMDELRSIKDTLEFQNMQTMDSLRYAERIQSSILPGSLVFETIFKEFFIIFKPKDIVSGDFYWAHQKDDNTFFLAVVDCTGHGVPGAFMSIIGHNILHNSVVQKGIEMPSQILFEQHFGILETLKQDKSSNNDGMDLSVIRIDKLEEGNYRVTYAGAKTTVFYLKNGKLETLRGDRISVGGNRDASQVVFNDKEVVLSSNDSLYLYTDGFIDEPNEKRRRFGTPRFKKTLLSNAGLPMKEQKRLLLSALKDYRGENSDQRDDISVLGVCLP